MHVPSTKLRGSELFNLQATLEKPGSCCFNQLQKDESNLTGVAVRFRLERVKESTSSSKTQA